MRQTYRIKEIQVFQVNHFVQMPLKLGCCYNLWLQRKTRNIIKSKKRSRSSIVGPKKTSNCKELAHQARKTKSCKSDLRPHRASVCPHMFVCPSSSRIWSTCGFWAGRAGLIFLTVFSAYFNFCSEFVLELCHF